MKYNAIKTSYILQLEIQYNPQVLTKYLAQLFTFTAIYVYNV